MVTKLSNQIVGAAAVNAIPLMHQRTALVGLEWHRVEKVILDQSVTIFFLDLFDMVLEKRKWVTKLSWSRQFRLAINVAGKQCQILLISYERNSHVA